MTKIRTQSGPKKLNKTKATLGILALGALALIVLIVFRFLFPALTMGFVHIVTLPAYFFLWATLYVAIAFGILATCLKGERFEFGVGSVTGLLLLATIALMHLFAAGALGEYALFQVYGTTKSTQGIPIPAIESAKFVPRNIAETRLRTAGDNSQLNVTQIDEGIIITKEGESHIGFIAFMRGRDLETKISGNTELVYIDAHNGQQSAKKKLVLRILPGGTVGSDPERAFYASLPWWDGTSHDSGEIIPIINELDESLKLAMPVTTPKTSFVGIVPISNIPVYSGIVLINPVAGTSKYRNVSEVQADPVLSRARLFPAKLADEVAEASRFAGVQGLGDFIRALLPSQVSSYSNYELAPEPEEAGNWPALYTSGTKGKEKAFLYFPYLPNSSSRALAREVSINADSGEIHVKNIVGGVASPGWIIDSVLKQRLAAEQLLQSSFGQFDEPTPLELDGKRFYVFPITSKAGSAVIAYAISGTKIGDQTGQVQVQFVKTPQEVESWLSNPQFTNQNLREVFLGQSSIPNQGANQQPAQQSENLRLETKIDALTEQVKALTKAIEAQQKK